MRVLVAIAILACGIAGALPARAADLHVALRGHALQYSPVGRRAEPLIVLAYEPGVTMRAYWRRPWCDRHYFPFGRDRWDRRRAHVYVRPKPAQSFYRYWSNSQDFVEEVPLLHAHPPAGFGRPSLEK